MFIKNTIFARKFLHILMIFTLVGFSFNVYSEDVAEEVTEIEDKLEEEEDQDNANNDVEALKEIYVRALKVHTELNPERKSELEAEINNG